MNQARAEQLDDALRRAVAFLDRTLTAPPGEIQRTAAIKAFEYCYELAWKLLRARLAAEGVAAQQVYATIAGPFRDDAAALLGPGPQAGPGIGRPVSRP